MKFLLLLLLFRVVIARFLQFNEATTILNLTLKIAEVCCNHQADVIHIFMQNSTRNTDEFMADVHHLEKCSINIQM